jgi:Co/Zn/Cd efflux system component
MYKTTFHISKMDCPSEENLIRMKLDGIPNIRNLQFDIPKRQLTVYHEGGVESIDKAVSELNFNSTLISTEQSELQISNLDHKNEKQLLWTVLLINFSLFVLEIITGFFSGSMGLVADSLDMLADSIVYGLSLYAVGHIAAKKKSVAKISGYFQLLLALFGLAEVLRRFLGYEEVPAFQTMIIISILALIGNATSLYLLQKSKSEEAHMKASMIFTSNDVIVNIGVIIAGIAVYFTKSKYPDLVVGSIVFVLVANGAFRILKLAK